MVVVLFAVELLAGVAIETACGVAAGRLSGVLAHVPAAGIHTASRSELATEILGNMLLLVLHIV